MAIFYGYVKLPEGTLVILPLYIIHGSLNVPIEHHPTIRYMVYNGYYKVMSNIPKMGQLPTPDILCPCFFLRVRHPSCAALEHKATNIFRPSWAKRIQAAQEASPVTFRGP